MMAFQRCAGVCCTTTWISCMYTYNPPQLLKPPSHRTPHHHQSNPSRSSKSTNPAKNFLAPWVSSARVEKAWFRHWEFIQKASASIKASQSHIWGGHDVTWQVVGLPGLAFQKPPLQLKEPFLLVGLIPATPQSGLLFQDQSNLVETPITALAAWPQTNGFNLSAS